MQQCSFPKVISSIRKLTHRVTTMEAYSNENAVVCSLKWSQTIFAIRIIELSVFFLHFLLSCSSVNGSLGSSNLAHLTGLPTLNGRPPTLQDERKYKHNPVAAVTYKVWQGSLTLQLKFCKAPGFIQDEAYGKPRRSRYLFHPPRAPFIDFVSIGIPRRGFKSWVVILLIRV